MTKCNIGNVHSLESFGTVDGPGVRYVVFLQGCPMRCLYCHNPDTWDMQSGSPMTPREICGHIQKNIGFYKNGGVTVSGGEPMLQPEFVTELFSEVKKLGLHTALDTSGICYNPQAPHAFDQMLAVCDLVLLDIKHIDNSKHQPLCGVSNQNTLAFAKYLSGIQKEVWIRHVVVPGYTDKKEDLQALGEFIGTLKNVKALEVLPYHKLGVSKYEKLNLDYPLKDVAALSKEAAIAARKEILRGIKKIRDTQN